MPRRLYIAAIGLFALTGIVAAAENGLGIPILPAPPERVALAGETIHVQFAAWLTRVQDFARFVAATQYDAVGGALSLGRDGWKAVGDSWQHPGFPQRPDHPVVCVSYFDALAFCRWLTKTEREAVSGPAPDQCVTVCAAQMTSACVWRSSTGLTMGENIRGPRWPPDCGRRRTGRPLGTAGIMRAKRFWARVSGRTVGNVPKVTEMISRAPRR